MTIRDFFCRLLNNSLEHASIFTAPIISWMARSGAGTNRCLKYQCLPLPVHFYSPVPDIDDLEQRNIWEKKSQLIGIDFQIEKQVALLRNLGEKYGNECTWPHSPTANPTEFYIDNNSFSFGCAAALHSMIRHCKPKRILEVGSGNSSIVINNAINQNRKKNCPAEYVVIDPFPSELVTQKLTNVTKVIIDKVELTDESLFVQLDQNDLLFIDSGHVVKTGGDVNFLILEILPRLKPGVIIHFHDIGLPFEYPKTYFTNPQFRVFWTEAYLLQAFLSFNPYFEVLLGMNYLMREKTTEFKKAFPHYNPDLHKSISGSFWIRRKS